MRHLRSSLVLIFFAGLSAAQQTKPPELKYAVIVTRHGVRAPTWDPARLNQYSAEPWPNWGVPPADLTPHGRQLIKLMGSYYRDLFSTERLLSREGCQDAAKVYIWADTDQRTLETGRALAESLEPGCNLSIHSRPPGESDSLFEGAGTPDLQRSLKTVLDRLGPDPQKLLADHRPALDLLQSILAGGKPTTRKLIEPPAEIAASVGGKAVELKGPFATGSTLSENLLLEYTNGMQGKDLGWGRLTREDLFAVLEVHAVYADLLRRTRVLAQARGSNLLAHVLASLEQAEARTAVAGSLGRVGDKLLVVSGHDTNLSNLSGMLGLTWTLPGYQPDDTPPGGALIFSLWQDSGGNFVRLRYIAQTVDQMRNAEPLTLSAPPPSQEVSIPGCEAVAQRTGCPWGTFKGIVQKAIDPTFVAKP